MVVRNQVIFLPLFALVLIGGSCRNNPVIIEPIKECEYPPGNRTFSWQVDTVGWFPSSIGGVWAFADDDAYVMGLIWQKNEKDELEFTYGLHWNGQEWTTNLNGSLEDINHFSNDVTGDTSYMVSVGYRGIGQEKASLAEFDNTTKQWTGYQFETEGELRAVWTDGNGYVIAVGDNGMVYTKNSYQTPWVYSKAPTEFNLTQVDGVSDGEIYIRGFLSVPGEFTYYQIWKYGDEEWDKLFDSQDTTGTYLSLEGANPPNYGGIGDIASYRCSDTDSLQLYIIGNESFLVTAAGQSLSYEVLNLSDRGLPLRQNQRTGLRVDFFTPNDIWIYGTRYNFYHWNGIGFTKMEIPGLPNDDAQFGFQRDMVKTSSGKVFLPTEVASQVYVVVQGTPKN